LPRGHAHDRRRADLAGPRPVRQHVPDVLAHARRNHRRPITTTSVMWSIVGEDPPVMTRSAEIAASLATLCCAETSVASTTVAADGVPRSIALVTALVALFNVSVVVP